MENGTSEEITESDYSDSFIASDDDDNEDGLTWDSDDSRPPGPSPPPSAMNNSPLVNIVARLRPQRRRFMRHFVEASENTVSDSHSDEERSTVSPASTVSDPPSPAVSTFLIREDSEADSAANGVREDDSDETQMSFEPRSPDYHIPADIGNSRPHSPNYPPPQSSDSDVQIADGPTGAEETVADAQIRPESPNPPEIEQPPPPLSTSPTQLVETAAPEQHITSNATTPPAVLNSSVLSESDEGSLCSICMDPLTNSGKHRVVCLRCGHVFGQSCLERWIKVGCNNGAKRCPTCNKRACLKDIRVLYLPKVIPLDTVEKDRLIQEKEEIMSQKNVLEMELARCKLQNALNTKKYEEKLKNLETQYMEALNAIEQLNQGKKIVAPNLEMKRDGVRSELLHLVEITKEGGCRVLAYSHHLHELVVSQPSGNTLFAGYGVRVINTVDFMPGRFVFLHQKMIRDLAFHSEDKDLLLSVSLDHTAKLVDWSNGKVVHTFKGEGPLWSCCWDATNPHLLLTGSQMGKVCQYDRRMTDHYIHLWDTKNNFTPVVALSPAPSVADSAFPQGGFLSCRLNSVLAYARHGEKYTCQELPLEGPFMSMLYDYSSQNLLTTSRPSSRCPYARINLNLVDVDKSRNICLPQIHTFNCGSSARVLSRLTTIPSLDDSLVVAHHESGRTVNMWSSKTGSLAHSFSIKEPVIDFSCVTLPNNKCLLATLSDKKVGIYKVT